MNKLKRKIQYICLGIIGLLTFNKIYNVEALRSTLIKVGLMVELTGWIPVELKEVKE